MRETTKASSLITNAAVSSTVVLCAGFSSKVWPVDRQEFGQKPFLEAAPGQQSRIAMARRVSVVDQDISCFMIGRKPNHITFETLKL
jgi:hypothetical protein